MALKPDLTVPVLGLNVDGNPLIRPRGSLAQADNIVLRQPGKAEPAMGPVSVASERLPNFTPDASTYGVRVFCQGDENVLAIERPTAGGASADATKLRQSDDPTNEVGTVALGSSTRTLSFDNQRTQHAYTDGRHFITSEAGVLALDGLETSSNQTLRLAGMPSPVGVVATAHNSTDPLVADLGTFVSYVAVLRRTVAGKYTVTSAPTTTSTITGSANFGATLVVTLGAADPLVAGDEVVVYKTKAGASAGTVVPVFYECLVHSISSAELAARSVSLTDLVHDDDLDGAELYTNDGQDGPLNVNYLPPLASDVCAYAGSALYVNRRSWPVLTLRANGRTGVLATGTPERTYGIGSRPYVMGSPSATSPHNVDDAEVVGLKVGQRITRGFSTFDTAVITSIVHNGVNDNDVFYSGTVAGPPSTTFYAVDTFVLDFGSAGTVRVPVTGWEAQLQASLAALTIPGIRCIRNTADTEIRVVATVPGTVDSFSATNITNGGNYTNTVLNGSSYELASIQDTRQNLVWFSKLQQPEAVSPLANFVVGAEKVLRNTKVGQVVLSWCTDGLYLVQGDAANGFTSQQLDPKCVLYHPSAVAVLGNTAYALTYSGIVRAGENGLESVSKNAVDSLIQAAFIDRPDTWSFAAVADTVNNEVRFSFPGGTTLVYNAQTGQWAARPDGMIHGCFDRGADTSGRYTPDVIITNTSGYYCDGDHCAPAVLIHNSIAPDSPTAVHQYVDTCLMFENDVIPEVGVSIDGVTSRTVNTSASHTAHELQCSVPRRAARKPRLTVGFSTVAGDDDRPTWSYSGFGCRYRSSTTKVKR